MEGKITKIIRDRGFGFIEVEGGKDMFFHISDSPSFDVLEEGIQVRFELKQDEKSGRDCGKNVVAV